MGSILNHLVVTAIGTDRPGIVSKLSRLTSDCDCNIVDSRVALFGNEFTLIMMISGTWPSIAKVEAAISEVSAELELLTVMKQTSKHTAQDYGLTLEVSFNGNDHRGTMTAITQFLADRSLDLAIVRSHADMITSTDEVDTEKPSQNIFIAIHVPANADVEQLEQEIEQLANQLSLTCSIARVQNIESS